MSIRLALLALVVGLWGCGDDTSPPPTSPGETVLRPTGELKSWDLSSIVPVESVRAMPEGTTVFMRTEFAHGKLADLEMTFVQVVDDYLAPMPVYMLEASDPVLIQLGGVAVGMSGSPIFTEQGTWGAIAYGFNQQDSPPYYFFATPIEWVIGTRGLMPAAKPTATWEGHRITPLDLPLLSTGLNRVHPLPEGNSSLLSESIAAGTTSQRQASFEAGRPMTIGLLLGEVTIGTLGSISYVDGNRVYGFGQQTSGIVELPIIEAKVLGEISHLSAPYKFATLNPIVRGTLTEDSLPGVRGVLDEGPELVPVKSVYTFPSEGTVELAHRMAARTDPYISIDLVVKAFFAPLANRVEYKLDQSIRVTTDISFVGTDATLARSRLYASPEGGFTSSIVYAYNDVSSTLEELMTRNDYALQVREAEVHIELIPEPRFAAVTKVAADTVISLGNTLNITTSLRVGRRIDREIELALSVPDTLPLGFYQLEVGSVAELGDDAGGGGEPETFFGPLAVFDDFGDEETLDDVFARENKPDENILLKARLTFVSPPDEEILPEPRPDLEGESEEEPEVGIDVSPAPGAYVPPFSLPPPIFISTQEDVDLALEGIQTLLIQVVAGDEQT